MTINTPHRVIAVTYPDGQILDVVGPLEVFSRTARLLRDRGVTPNLAYEVEIAATEPGPVRMSSGLDLIATRAYRYIRQIDTLIVAGGIGAIIARDNPDLIRWIQRQHQRGNIQRIASVCTGALILGKAGLLDGLRATTHWDYCDELARTCPTCEVDPDAIFIRQGNLYTSAGVTAGMDLALALVEQDWGKEIALAVAQELVMYMKRPGGQSQFSSAMEAQNTESDRFRALLLWIQSNLDDDLSVQVLAERVSMSPRNFARAFVRESNETPARYVQRLRLEAARRELEDSSRNVDQIAADCGFGTAETMRRTFIRHLRVSPNDYRHRFQGSLRN